MALRIETEDGILRCVFEGATPARDIYAAFHQAFAEAKPDQQLLVDLRQSTSLADRTPEFVRMLTEFVVEHPQRPGDRVAVVIPPNETTRWTDLVEDVSDADHEIQLFEHIGPAEGWLRD